MGTSTLPQHKSRFGPSFSASDIQALAQQALNSARGIEPRPPRPSSMVFPVHHASHQQQQAGATQPPPHADSIGQIDTFEPRMFPGVVSRRRRSTVVHPGDAAAALAGQQGGESEADDGGNDPVMELRM